MAREYEKNNLEEEAFLDDPEAEPVEEDDDLLDDVATGIGGGNETDSLKSEITELKDRLLRSLADLENTRKRAERDRRDAETYGATRLARDLLSVNDNFDRALDNITDDVRSGASGLVEGIELTRRDLLSAFEKHKINRIEPEKGDRFDPKLHQAMFEAPVPGTKSGDIIQIMNVGFTIGERLLRPAQVGVSSGGPAVPADHSGQ